MQNPTAFGTGMVSTHGVRTASSPSRQLHHPCLGVRQHQGCPRRKRGCYNPGVEQHLCKVSFRCWRKDTRELRELSCAMMVMPGAGVMMLGFCLPHGRVLQQDLSAQGGPRGRGDLGRLQSQVLLAFQVLPEREGKSA